MAKQLYGDCMADFPEGWQAEATRDGNFQSMAFPFTSSVRARRPGGGALLFARTGAGYVQVNRHPVTRHRDGAKDESSDTPMRRLTTVGAYIDGEAAAMTRGATDVRFLGVVPFQPDIPLAEEERRLLEQAREEFAAATTGAAGGSPSVGAVLCQAEMRAYSYIDQSGQPMALAVAAFLEADEWSVPSPLGQLAKGAGKLKDMLGNAINESAAQSGLENASFLKKYVNFGMKGGLLARNRQATPPPPPAPAPPVDPVAQKSAVLTQGTPGTLMSFTQWGVRWVAGLFAPLSELDALLPALARLAAGFDLSPAAKAEARAISRERAAAARMAQQQQFAAMQRAHAAQQQAFDRQNQAWRERTNAQDAARRASYQSKMAAEDRMREKRSEAIRGVNTYIRPDGSEVEHSVSADRVFQKENDSTVRVGTTGGDMGAGWIELERKK